MTVVERVIRLLMCQGWFREPKPGYFANNRLSNLIKKDQPGYHLATYMYIQITETGCCSILTHRVRNDLFNKVTVAFPDMLNHPDSEFRKNTDPLHTAFQLSYKTDVSFFGAGGWLTKDPGEAIKFGLAYGTVNIGRQIRNF